MKYENAGNILPEELVRQIQVYVSSTLLYIPSGSQKRSWGETSGYKQYILERNRDIRTKFHAGTSVEQLAKEYCLSHESLKKIVYVKKEAVFLDYKSTLASAKAFAENGRLEEWVHAYLVSDGHNQEFSDGLKRCRRFFLGPVSMPLKLFHRCCGPEETMRWKVDKAWFETHVAQLEQVIKQGTDLPPLIVHFIDGDFEVNDGNHRLEAYHRLSVDSCEVIVWMTLREEKEEFLRRYGQRMA